MGNTNSVPSEVPKYQPAGRAGHRSNVVGNKLYVWSGYQRDRPVIHSSEAKQRYNSRVEILDLITGNWRQCPTTGNPPLGFINYASAVIDNNIIYFGGQCGHDRCSHNSLTSLCVDTMQWKELSPTNPHTGPMMKSACGMIPVKIDGKYHLLVIGGCGPSVNTPQQDTAQYSDKGMQSGYIRTNEQHYFNLSTGQWISPIVSGDCPPPCSSFTLTSLTDNTFLMFGGYTPDDLTNAVYIGNCTQSTITWQKVNPLPGTNWPNARFSHDTAALDEHNIIMIGGFSTSDYNDCWIFNIKIKLWKELTLPLSVTKRFWHSVSSFNVTSDIVWVIVFGGVSFSESYISDTSVIELIRNDDGEWCVGEVMTHPLNDYQPRYLLKQGLQQQSSSYVNVKIIKSVLMGPPGVGKTAFKSFLFNLMTSVKKHHSTPISTVPVRAMLTSRMTELNNAEWLDIDSNPDKLFHMLADAIKYLALPKEVQAIDEGTIKETTPPVASIPPAAVVSDDMIPVVTQSAVLTEFNEPVATDRVVEQPIVSATDTHTALDPSEVQGIVDLLPKVEGSGALFDTNWVYLLDTGGQPQFADVSRPFIRVNSVYFILHKLIEKLSDRPDFCYSEDGKPLATPCKLHMTNLQLIKHFICSIMSSMYEEGAPEEESSSIVQPLVSIIGTYDDEYQKLKKKGKAPESIEEKDGILLQELEKFLNRFIYHDLASNKLIHPVNNLCTGSERSQASLDLRKKLLLDIQGQVKPREVNIPVHQYLFDILVKNQIKSSGKESHGILTLEECNDIGRKLGIDVKDTLKFFDSLNLYLYFADLKPLQHVVFTNPQYLLKLLSQVIQVSFVNQPSIPTSACRTLRDTGIFDDSLLDQLNLQFVPPHFTKEHFLQLLKFTRIIASVSSTQYFLPVALPPDELSLDEKQKFTDTCTCDPLFVKFNCNIVPQGVFLTIVVNLLNRQHPPTFSVNNNSQTRTISKQLRYTIEFSSKELSGSLLLVEEFCWIEIYFNGMVCDCCTVRDAVKEAIGPCAKLLGYKPSALQYDLLFACCLPEHKDRKLHLVESVNIDICKAKCNRMYPLNIERQLCWFTGNIDVSPVITGCTKPELRHLCTLLAPIAPQYSAIGTALSAPMSTLGLQYSPDTHQDNLRRTLEWWLNNGNRPDINSPVTWDNIITVIEGPVIQNYQIAQQMREFITNSQTGTASNTNN